MGQDRENKQNTQLRETYAVLRVGNFYQKMKKCELRQMAAGFLNGIFFFLKRRSGDVSL